MKETLQFTGSYVWFFHNNNVDGTFGTVSDAFSQIWNDAKKTIYIFLASRRMFAHTKAGI